jgi:hypothetical protein
MHVLRAISEEKSLNGVVKRTVVSTGNGFHDGLALPEYTAVGVRTMSR